MGQDWDMGTGTGQDGLGNGSLGFMTLIAYDALWIPLWRLGYIRFALVLLMLQKRIKCQKTDLLCLMMGNVRIPHR